MIRTMKELDEHVEKVAHFYDPHRYVWLGFLRGIAYGLGILVALAIVVPVIITLLSTIEWVPLVGDFVSEIIRRIEAAKPL